MSRPRFGTALVAIAAVGLVARLVYVLVVMHGVPVGGDGLEFHILANQLADGHGYIQPLIVSPGHVATADKPPLYPLLLALPSLAGIDSVAAHRFVSCLMGGLLVAVTGLLGRRVGGDRVGLIAAGLAAVYPMLWILDGSVRSESLYAPLIALVLLQAYRLADAPSAGRAAVLGALVGLATLTRSEALALLVLLVVPLLPLLPRGRRLAAFGACAAACALVLAPWVIRNAISVETATLSTNSGSLLYGANCDAAYYSGRIGTWPCYPPPALARGPERDVAPRLREEGIDYATDHAGRLPAVVAVRVLRTWDLWSPPSAARLEAGIADRNLTAHWAGVIAYWLLLPLAVVGAVLVRRSGLAPLRVLLAPVAMVVLVGALAYGTTRFRVPAEIPIVVLAAVAIAALTDRLRGAPR